MPAPHWIHLPPGWHASKHSAQCTELAVGQLSRFHHTGLMPSKFAVINPMDYHVWGAMLAAYHKF